jgi:hypothetical protein
MIVAAIQQLINVKFQPASSSRNILTANLKEAGGSCHQTTAA